MTAVQIDSWRFGPVDITTPDVLYRKHTVAYADGLVSVEAAGEIVLASEPVAWVEKPGDHDWTFHLVTGEAWTVAFSTRCCGGPAIIPRVRAE